MIYVYIYIYIYIYIYTYKRDDYVGCDINQHIQLLVQPSRRSQSLCTDRPDILIPTCHLIFGRANRVQTGFRVQTQTESASLKLDV